VPRFTVVWAPDVQDDFIEQWLVSDSAGRQHLRNIANSIDRELALQPETRGTPLPSAPAVRVWRLPQFSPAVSVTFEVLADDRTVRVLRIAVAGE
jgi:hypothetical protein